MGYPSGFVAKYVYTSLGYLSQVKDNASGAVLYTVIARNADLSLTQGSFGNGVAQADTYDPNTGRLTAVQAGPSNGVANFAYAYDLAGNTTFRKDAGSGVTERFCYDALDRLTQAALAVGSDPGAACAGGTVTATSYDALGDLLTKTGVGTYSYPMSGAGSVRPHAMASITGTVNGVINPTYSYDANGNLTGGAGRTVTSSSFNMALAIVQGTTGAKFLYDPEHARSNRTDLTGGAVTGSTAYVADPGTGASAELTNDGTALHWHDYLQVDGHYVAERFCDGYPACTGAVSWGYFVTDPLGSIAAITDAAGAVSERDAFDPWGRPRLYATGADDPNCGAVPTPITRRGYTGHERIDALCQVNANARIYDPTVAKFMSPDTTVTDPGDLQDWNPYSYVSNRPMTLTDPSGHEGCNASICGTGASASDHLAEASSLGSSNLSDVYVFQPDGSEAGTNGGGTAGSGSSDTNASGGASSSRNDSTTSPVRVAQMEGSSDETGDNEGETGSSYRDFARSRDRAIERERESERERELPENKDAKSGSGSQHSQSNPSITINLSTINLTRTVESNLATRPFLNSVLTIREIMSTGPGRPDPGGVPGAVRYDALGSYGTSSGTYELVINPITGMVYHFNFVGGGH